jgi:uncharacterized delta-60 repeat protein
MMINFSARIVVPKRRFKRFVVVSVTTTILLLICSTNLLIMTQAASGDLDQTFDNDGKVVTEFFGQVEVANAIALQEDGKLVVAGYTQQPSMSQTLDFALARFNPDGSLDNTFDGDGKVITGFSPNHRDVANALVIQSDGKIILGGSTSFRGDDDNTDFGFALARYNPDGSLDNTFDSDGKVVTNISNPTGSFLHFREGIYSLALQDDGKILATGAGLILGLEFSDFATIRYNTDGSLDTTFGTNGKVFTAFPHPNGADPDDAASEVFIQENGTILVAGRVHYGELVYGLAKYNTDGSPDMTFGQGGKTTTNFPRANYNSGNKDAGVAIQADGKIVLGGYTEINAVKYFALTRLEVKGDIDTSFGDGGQVTTNFAGSIHALKIQNDGTILAAGDAPNGSGNFALAQFDCDGNLDESFGNNGIITTDFSGGADRINALAIQCDGRILAAGSATNSTGNLDFAIARYLGSLVKSDFDFDGDSTADVAVWEPSSGMWFINNSSDGSTSSMGWGTNGDTIVPADYDGDGRTDIAVWRPSNGTWYIQKSSDNGLQVAGWGIATDKPVPADYDGDGYADVAVWRPTNGTWYIQKSSNKSLQVVGWGADGDVPASGRP